jgi:hypothetical protein
MIVGCNGHSFVVTFSEHLVPYICSFGHLWSYNGILVTIPGASADTVVGDIAVVAGETISPIKHDVICDGGT